MPEKQTNFVIEAVKQAKSAWIIYSVFIAYAALTILDTSDRQLVLNGSARLPFFNSEIPLNAYFIITPLLSVILFLYFHLQLNILKAAIHHKNEKDSETLKDLHPWIIIVFEDSAHSVIGWLQKRFVSISIWWSLPIILMIFAVWVIKKHNPWLSYFADFMPLIGVISLIFFWCKFHTISLTSLIRKPGIMSPITIVILFNLFLLFFLIPWSNNGRHFGLWKDYYYSPSYSPGVLKSAFNYLLIVDLRREIVSIKPSIDYRGIYWAELSGIHLEGADLTAAVLKRADLRGSFLQYANLTSTDMSEANLSGANLYECWLGHTILEAAKLHKTNLAGVLADGANLKNCDLSQSNFNGADLSEANLEETKLYQSDFENSMLYKTKLCGADLRSVNFRRALLSKADLAGADLENAWFDESNLKNVKNLTINQLSKVKTLYKAIMDDDIRKEIAKQFPHLLDKPIEKERPKMKFEMIFPGWDKGPDQYKIYRTIFSK